MAKEESKPAETSPPPQSITEDIKFEVFCDSFVVSHRKGVFLLMMGQSAYVPPRMLLRMWIDAQAMKILVNLLQEQVKKYEEQNGKIE
jgi:hypothetical protein